MFGKSKVQSEFKKQMKQIEKEMLLKEKNGDGTFSNKIYKEKFYGQKYEAKTMPITIRRVIGNIFLIIFGIIISSIFTTIYQNIVAVLFYNKEKGGAILRIILGITIILPHIAMTQGIMYFLYKKFRKKSVIVLSLYNLILTVLIAMVNITLLTA